MKLPNSGSKQWYGVGTFLFFLFFCVLIASRLLLSVELGLKQFIGLGITAFILSCIIGLSGFFGKKTFVIICSSFSTIGFAYALFISFTRMNVGWSDVTSIISFLVISTFGIIVGVIAEIVRTLLKKSPSKKSHL
ncbi:permease [Anoxybacillus kestanbolensis]|uniref:Permease n=1 Tax=Anoxybacillus kestanbolensis TaxID=227476 RepID=A0A1V3FRH6_9BACL|nr:permease [Anoxybacillus kestanbolensis]OOE04313.1 permease [Anoxybacillus kestanbolensis]